MYKGRSLMTKNTPVLPQPIKHMPPKLKIIAIIGTLLLAFYLASTYYLLSVPYVALGVVDGLNVCSITFMALILSVLYNLNTDRTTMRILGLAYILGVSGTYFAIGVGILWFALALPMNTFTVISSIIMLVLGGLNIVSYFQPRFTPPNLLDFFGHKAIQYIRRLSLPSLIAAGIMIGLHNLPCCTGSIYITSLVMIANDPLMIIPLISYNIGYVLPLASILVICSSKSFALRFRKEYAANARHVKMLLGIIMVFISVVILFMTH
jgi:hypothetical protein